MGIGTEGKTWKVKRQRKWMGDGNGSRRRDGEDVKRQRKRTGYGNGSRKGDGERGSERGKKLKPCRARGEEHVENNNLLQIRRYDRSLNFRCI